TKSLGQTFYINVGSWAEEEPDPNEKAGKAYRADRTHLVIHACEDRHEAHLYEWRSGEGPRMIQSLISPVLPEATVVVDPRRAGDAPRSGIVDEGVGVRDTPIAS